MTAKTPVTDLTRWQNNMPWSKGAFAGSGTPITAMNPLPQADALDYARMGVQLASMLAGPKEAKTMADDSYLFGKTVVHGSPTSGLTEITPSRAPYRPQEAFSYGWNPIAFDKDPARIYNSVDEYTQPKSWMGSLNNPDELGSVYVGKVPRSSIVEDPSGAMIVSDMPIKNLQEIRMKLAEPNEFGYRFKEDYTDALKSALARKGVIKGPDFAGIKNRLTQRLRPEIYNGPV